MIKTWIADVSPLYDEKIYKKYYESVPYVRQDKADKIKHIEDKALSIGAFALYEKALGLCGETEDKIFNLSHSGKYAICSVSCGKGNHKVGCDIEKIKNLHKKIVQKYFCESEKVYILSGNIEEQTESFYRYWVLKESFAKATRYGMAMGLDSFEIECTEKEGAKIVKQPSYVKEKYFFHEYNVGIPYKIAVCSTCSDFGDKIEEIYLK